MKKLTSLEIRKMWLDFFKSKGHEIVPSAPLIPQDDDSLLWINAGGQLYQIIVELLIFKSVLELMILKMLE